MTGDPPTYELKWGSRALAETTRLVCRIYDNDPKNWKSQYQEVLETEGDEDGNGVANGGD